MAGLGKAHHKEWDNGVWREPWHGGASVFPYGEAFVGIHSMRAANWYEPVSRITAVPYEHRECKIDVFVSCRVYIPLREGRTLYPERIQYL